MPPEAPRTRLVIAGGGTGGHVMPAIATLDELRRRDALEDVLWIGGMDGIEREAAGEAGVPFVAIPTGKLRRYLSLRNVVDAGRVPLGVLAARRALRQFRPSVILSTGGFVSVPTVIASRGIAPALTHEQTAVLGLATRINARTVAALAVSHERAAKDARTLHQRVVVTGNPVRAGLDAGSREAGLTYLGFEPSRPIVLVTGGARGASPINTRVESMMPGLLEMAQVVHQTGPAIANADAANLATLRNELPEPLRRRYVVTEFIRSELADVYAAADLVVGRAGAGAVAELALLGKPSILIPLPGAGGDEQTANAKVLVEVGGAVLLPQEDATPDRLRGEIEDILMDADRRASMSKAAKSVARPDAAHRLADELLELSERGRKARRP